jgi:chondroitin synthase
MTRLSVVILCHNQAEMLARALFSLVSQAARLKDIALQLVVVDNGSHVPVEIKRLPAMLRSMIEAHDITVLRREAAAVGFAVAAARNAGIAAADGDIVIFLDADCIPAPMLLQSYVAAMSSGPAVLIGHRYFVRFDDITEGRLRADLNHLYQVPQIGSDSNFGLVVDRRLPELVTLDTHPMPFNCLHGCNFAVLGATLKALSGFDPEFDGAWGFEDIEFGYRLFRHGLPFRYVPMAHVFHQDAPQPSSVNRQDTRNLHLAHRKIPGYAAYRPVLKASTLFPDN